MMIRGNKTKPYLTHNITHNHILFLGKGDGCGKCDGQVMILT